MNSLKKEKVIRTYTYKGEKYLTLKDCAKACGFSYGALRNRVYREGGIETLSLIELPNCVIRINVIPLN